LLLTLQQQQQKQKQQRSIYCRCCCGCERLYRTAACRRKMVASNPVCNERCRFGLGAKDSNGEGMAMDGRTNFFTKTVSSI
jgi:hypothetical protein